MQPTSMVRLSASAAHRGGRAHRGIRGTELDAADLPTHRKDCAVDETVAGKCDSPRDSRMT